MKRGRGLLTGFLALGLLLASAPAAIADHHAMKIREFYPGLAAVPQDSFLELQMYASFQNMTANEIIRLFPPGDDPAGGDLVLNPTIDPPNGENQRTILVGGTALGSGNYDYEENIDQHPSFSSAGGALCFVSESALIGVIDCVEWGIGNENVSADPPVLPGGIPNGSSITRSIAPGCATFLEASDDTNSSAADFAQTAPTPRTNADPITETTCTQPPVNPPANPPATPAQPKKKKKCKKPKQRSALAAKKKKCKKK